MEKIKLKKEYITLGQLLKYVNIASSGLEAKLIIQDGFVFVNGKKEQRRGRKLYSGDQITYDNKFYEIV